MSNTFEKLFDLMKMLESLEDGEEDELKDSWKVGPASNRKKLYLDFSDPKLVKKKIDMVIGATEYLETLKLDEAEDEEELEEIEKKRLERLDEFLAEATSSKEREEDD